MVAEFQIGERLKTLRQEKGCTQKEIATVLGINPTAYSKIERAANGLSFDHCIKLADFYGVTCDYILRGISSENVDICRETGLTDTAVQGLREIRRLMDEVDATIEKGVREWPKVSLAQKGCAVLYLVNSMLSGEARFLDCLADGCVDVMECMMSAAVSAAADPDEMGFHSVRKECRKTASAANYAASVRLAYFLDKATADPVFLLALRKYSVNMYKLTDEEVKAQWERLGITHEKAAKVEKTSNSKASSVSQKM